MTGLSGARFGAVVAAVLLVTRAALAASPIPEFPQDGTVAVQDVPDSFGKLRRFLQQHRSPVGARYHVAVVALSDPHDREGPDYGDESGAYIHQIVEAWRPRVDTERSVIVLLALRNRDIIVHPFSKWARLGWEQQAVVDTIDGSPFASFARAGDYERAISELILAIDGALGTRVELAEEQARRAKELVSLTRSRNAGFEDIARQAGYDPPGAREHHQQALSGVESATRALEAGDARQGFLLASKAADAAAEAERLIASLKESDAAARAERREQADRLARLEQALAAADFDTSASRTRLERAKAGSATVDTLLEERKPDEALQLLGEVRGTLELAEQSLAHARQSHEFRTQTLPRLGAWAAGLALGAWLLFLLSRSARRRREAEALIAEWQTLLGRAADNLLKLEDEHALILGRADLVERFDGASAAPVRAAARAVDDVFLSYDAAQRLLAEVQRELSLAGSLRMLRERPFARAIERLSIIEVIARTEDVTERKLFLPERREVRMKPPQLLVEMQAAWERALRLVEELEEGFRQAWDRLDRLKEELGSLEELERRLGELEVPSPLRDETAKRGRELARLTEVAQRDPLGASKDAVPLSVEVSTLLERTQRLLEAVSRVRSEAQPRREEGGATVSRLRGEGLVVGEPGFEPEAMLAHMDRMSRAAMAAVEAGRDTDAVAHASEAASTAAELLELCERTRRSREESAGHIAHEGERVRGLRERLPERRERIADLRQLHADSALQPALDNAEEATAVLDQAAQCLGEARSCVAPEVQRYLAGAELIDRARQLLDAVDALYQEIETKAEDLARARQATEQELSAAAQSSADLQALLSIDDVFASSATLRERQRLEAALAEARQAAGAERPDWLALREKARELASTLRVTLDRARAERDTWQQALELEGELSTRREACSEVLQRHADDREATNQRFREISSELESVRRKAKDSRPAWSEVLAGLQRVAEGLEEVNRMAETDFREAAGARKAIAGADEALRGADTYYGHGVKAELTGAREALQRASQLLAKRSYAEAASAAEDARQRARKARVDAQLRADELESRDRERRDWSGGSSSSSSSRGSGFSFSSSSSSFGSSSGRSSFGSSSGRSSFSSSSGRSKW